MSQVDSTAADGRGQTAAGSRCEPAAWLERLHARAADQVKDPATRLTVLGCHLQPVVVGGWPSWELCSRPGLPVDHPARIAYLVELQKVLVDAARTLLVLNPPAEPPDPDDGLQELWRRACDRMELPSTRMLLQAQCVLLSVDGTAALIAVDATWLAMVQSRRAVIEQALAEVLRQRVAVSLVARQEVQ